VIYGNKDLRAIPAIADYIDPSKCLDDVVLYDCLAGGEGGERFVFHGTTTTGWEGECESGDSWREGFSSEQSCETVSQYSQRRAVYFSNTARLDLESVLWKETLMR